MAYASPFAMTKELANQVRGILRAVDVHSLPRDQQMLVATIKRLGEDVRLDARDYEFANTLVEQQKSSAEVKERLTALRQAILKASEYNLFGASEVAVVSAMIETVVASV